MIKKIHADRNEVKIRVKYIRIGLFPILIYLLCIGYCLYI